MLKDPPGRTNLIDKIKARLARKDELTGVWESGLDDGSGLHAVWGWSFRFDPDHTGRYACWDEGKLREERPFAWQRLGQRSIRARYRDGSKWATIEYSLAVVNGPYRSRLLKLADRDAEGFWGCHAPVFKSRPRIWSAWPF